MPKIVIFEAFNSKGWPAAGDSIKVPVISKEELMAIFSNSVKLFKLLSKTTCKPLKNEPSLISMKAISPEERTVRTQPATKTS